MIKIAILSMWHVHAGEYAGFISEQTDAEISCVWDDDAIRGQQAAGQFNVRFTPDLNDALADCDAVVVDAPTSDHRDVILKAAKAAKHIFTEKVLAPTAAQAREIEAAIRASGKVFAVSFPHLNSGAVQYAKKLSDDGILGRLTNFRARNVHNGCEWLPEHWYDIEKTCGGAMMDLGAHPNYLAAYFLGKPVKITAILNSSVCPEGMDDNAVALIEFSNKAIAVVETGFLMPRSAGLIELEGTEGALVIENGELRYQSRKIEADGWVTPELPRPLPPVQRQWLDAILYGKKLPEKYGIDAAVNLTAMTESEYISNREGRTVILP